MQNKTKPNCKELKNKKLNNKGVAMVEFAIAITIVITLLLGIIDLSIYYNGLTVARETARRITKDAIVNTDFALDTRQFPNINANIDEINRVQAARSAIIQNSFETFDSSVLARSTEAVSYTHLTLPTTPYV